MKKQQVILYLLFIFLFQSGYTIENKDLDLVAANPQDFENQAVSFYNFYCNIDVKPSTISNYFRLFNQVQSPSSNASWIGYGKLEFISDRHIADTMLQNPPTSITYASRCTIKGTLELIQNSWKVYVLEINYAHFLEDQGFWGTTMQLATSTPSPNNVIETNACVDASFSLSNSNLHIPRVDVNGSKYTNIYLHYNPENSYFELIGIDPQPQPE